MKHNYPATQIIQYLYNELEAPEHLETEYAIENNPAWNDIHTKLQSALKALPVVQYFPKNSVVKSILAYSEA